MDYSHGVYHSTLVNGFAVHKGLQWAILNRSVPKDGSEGLAKTVSVCMGVMIDPCGVLFGKSRL